MAILKMGLTATAVELLTALDVLSVRLDVAFWGKCASLLVYPNWPHAGCWTCAGTEEDTVNKKSAEARGGSGAAEEQNELEGELSPENQLAASIQFGVLPAQKCAGSDAVHGGIENIDVIVVCDVLGFGSQNDFATFKFRNLEAFLQSYVSQDPAGIREAVASDLII